MRKYPVTATEYIKQVKRLTGKEIRLSASSIANFRKLEKKLMRHDIQPGVYVRVSVYLWMLWAEKNGLDLVPVNVLCSDTAIERYEESSYIENEEVVRGVLWEVQCLDVAGQLDAILYSYEYENDLDSITEHWCGCTVHELQFKYPRLFEEQRMLALREVASQHGLCGTYEYPEEIAGDVRRLS